MGAGCLTTISTFALELHSLPVGASYAYGGTSIAATTACLLIIYGVFHWGSTAAAIPC